MAFAQNPTWFLSACLDGGSDSARKTVNAIQSYLGVYGCAAAAAMLEKTTVLELTDSGLTDLSPLAWLGSLKRLVLRGNNLTDLSPLASLPSLEYVDVSYNQLTSLSPLGGLDKLRVLRAHGNPSLDASSAPPASRLDARWLTEDDACRAARDGLRASG